MSIGRRFIQIWYQQIHEQNAYYYLLEPQNCFDGLVLKSNGIAKQHQLAKLGKYKYVQPFNGKPLYQHFNKKYYLVWKYDNSWTVNDYENQMCVYRILIIILLWLCFYDITSIWDKGNTKEGKEWSKCIHVKRKLQITKSCWLQFWKLESMERTRGMENR